MRVIVRGNNINFLTVKPYTFCKCTACRYWLLRVILNKIIKSAFCAITTCKSWPNRVTKQKLREIIQYNSLKERKKERKSDKLLPKKKGGGGGGWGCKTQIQLVESLNYLRTKGFNFYFHLFLSTENCVGNLTCNNIFCTFQESNNTFSLKSLLHEAMAGNM